MSFQPYADEAAALQVGGLSIENRLDRVSLVGSLDLTRDRIGLQHAKRLRDLLTSVVAELERLGSALPEVAKATSADTVRNPFG